VSAIECYESIVGLVCDGIVSGSFGVLHLVCSIDRGLHATCDKRTGAVRRWTISLSSSSAAAKNSSRRIERYVGTGQLELTNSQLNLELSCITTERWKLLSTKEFSRRITEAGKFSGCQMMSSGWRLARLHRTFHRRCRYRCHRHRRCEPVDRRRRRGSLPCWLAQLLVLALFTWPRTTIICVNILFVPLVKFCLV